METVTAAVTLSKQPYWFTVKSLQDSILMYNKSLQNENCPKWIKIIYNNDGCPLAFNMPGGKGINRFLIYYS